MTKRIFFILFCVLCFLPGHAETDDLRHLLEQLEGVSDVERLESTHNQEKYLVRVRQLVNPRDSSAGTFMQRVIVAHAGFDRPTVLVTEGYGAAYALDPRYQEELSELLDANMVFVEHRYFLESTPEPCNWDYLTAENSAYDLHHVNQTFRKLYPQKWISTGISKGGQTTCLYRAYFPDDVDFSVPYVAPLNRNVEDGRHETFLRKVGTREQRKAILSFQKEVLSRREEMLPLLEKYTTRKKMTFRIPLNEVLDYCVLEYPFAFWQWGAQTWLIPSSEAETQVLFEHLVAISDPNYFADDPSPYRSFFVQAARELGYYGYDTEPLQEFLVIQSSKGYLNRIMLPHELINKITFSDALYQKVYQFLKDNDPKMIFIYGEIDPWTASRVPDFKGKKNEQIYIQPGGSHTARINNMPDKIKEKILKQIKEWLEE